jgi:hypothetical protein
MYKSPMFWMFISFKTFNKLIITYLEYKIKILSTKISTISMKLKNEIPKNNPKIPPIFETNTNNSILGS